MSFDSALEQLQQQAFDSFLLTIEYNTVSIITESNGVIKVFDSHARDSFGMPHPHGTCVLLEFDSVGNLTEYFKFLYRLDVVYEIKGVKINYVCNDLLQNVNTDVISHPSTINSNTSLHCFPATVPQKTASDNSTFNTQSYYIFIYSICFSTIKRCNYWNYQTENAIVEHAIELFDETLSETKLSYDLPGCIQICDSTIQVVYTSRHEGTLCFSSDVSKVALAELILANSLHNTGFLIWLENIALACIIENNMSAKKQYHSTKYFLVAPSETRELNLFKQLSDSNSVVDRLCDILNLNEPDVDEAEYILQFLSIPCALAKLERQRILRKHKSNAQKNTIRENERNNYESMSPVKKQGLFKRKKLKYEEMTPIKKQAFLENLESKYKEMDPIKKEALFKKLEVQYIEMDPTNKQILLENLHLKYKEMEPLKKKIFLENKAMVYKSMDSSKKEVHRERNRANMKRKYHATNSPQKAKKDQQHKKIKSISDNINLDQCISKFQSRIKEGPYYICSVCNRLLYRKSVKLLEKTKYSSVPKTLFTDIASFDNKEYICTTCHSKVLKGKIPCQAVYNDMSVDEIPAELALLEKLEQILIAQRIVFEKIVVMPKGQQKKVSGAICNVPVNCDQTCKVLPRPPERSGIIMLKLKRKLQFRGHVYFQAVRPQLVENALNWLLENNPLYRNVITDMSNIDENLKTLQQNDTSTDNGKSAKLTANEDDEIEENDDPLNTHRQATNETCLQSVLPDYPVTLQHSQSDSLGNEIYDIAPIVDNQCESIT